MAQISGAVVLTVATFTLVYVLRAIFRERKTMEHTLDLIESGSIKHPQ